jgi:hypothetical protein
VVVVDEHHAHKARLLLRPRFGGIQTGLFISVILLIATIDISGRNLASKLCVVT